MSKPPEGRNTWADPDFEITLPKTVHTTPLDELIRALDEGDGATLQERRGEIRAALVELRRYREVVQCKRCGCNVLGREPYCSSCVVEVST